MPLKKETKIGGFKIQPIPVKHNVENYGYIIKHEAMGKSLFLTDLCEFNYKIKDLNHIFIESNYSDEIIVDRLLNDSYSLSASENHLSIEQAIEVLKNNYSVSLQTVVLLHLSDGNSSAKEFRERVQRELSFDNVYVADKGMVIELNKEEF